LGIAKDPLGDVKIKSVIFHREMIRARRFRRVGWGVLAAGLVLVAARAGILPASGYQVLYWIVAAPGRVAGKGERSALLYFRASCLPYRYPREVLALATLGERTPGVEKSIFTCEASR
jgi:hypothetical protein